MPSSIIEENQTKFSTILVLMEWSTVLLFSSVYVHKFSSDVTPYPSPLSWPLMSDNFSVLRAALNIWPTTTVSRKSSLALKFDLGCIGTLVRLILFLS